MYSKPCRLRLLNSYIDYIDSSSQMEGLRLRQVTCLNQLRMIFPAMVDPSTSFDWRVYRHPLEDAPEPH